jgi:hypothetical protein
VTSRRRSPRGSVHGDVNGGQDGSRRRADPWSAAATASAARTLAGAATLPLVAQLFADAALGIIGRRFDLAGDAAPRPLTGDGAGNLTGGVGPNAALTVEVR